MADKQPGEFFLLDANSGMTVENGLRFLRLVSQGLDFVLEAPCATWRECISLRKRTDVPIMWDELGDSETAVDHIPVIDGHVTVSNLPGLGIEPNMDVMGEPVATYG